MQQILDRQQLEAILLVSSPYHMRRAHMVWNKIAPDITRDADAAAERAVLRAHPRRHRWRRFAASLWEYLAIGYYWWNGWL